MKFKVKPITGKKITFDFDGTLEDDFDGTINKQKEEIKNVLKQLMITNEIFIVTKRHSPKNSSLGKINEHIDVLRLAMELGIPGKNIIFTDRMLKAETLIQMGSDIHFENSEMEVQYMNQFQHNTQLVLITDPYWRDLVY
jgi:hypothetical protein